MIAAALLLAAQAAPTTRALPERPTDPIAAADALAMFRRLCVDTAGDPQRFAAALARESEAFRRQRLLPFPPGQGPTGFYLNSRAEVGFIVVDPATPNFPAALPTRSCSVRGRDTATIDHAALATAMARELTLTAGKTEETTPRGDRAVATKWTLPSAAGRVDYSLVTRSSPGGPTSVAMILQGFRSDR